MLTISDIKNIVAPLASGSTTQVNTSRALTGFTTDRDKRFFSACGYDAVIALLDNARGVEFPCMVLEDRVSGSLAVLNGGMDSYSVSLWVMDIVKRDENRETVLQRVFSLAKATVARLANCSSMDCLSGWDPTSVPYDRRDGGMDYVGYELILHFDEDVALNG